MDYATLSIVFTFRNLSSQKSLTHQLAVNLHEGNPPVNNRQVKIQTEGKIPTCKARLIIALE